MRLRNFSTASDPRFLRESEFEELQPSHAGFSTALKSAAPDSKVVFLVAGLIDNMQSAWDRRGITREPRKEPQEMATEQPTKHSLLERLDQGPVNCAEGYLFEFERPV